MKNHDVQSGHILDQQIHKCWLAVNINNKPSVISGGIDWNEHKCLTNKPGYDVKKCGSK